MLKKIIFTILLVFFTFGVSLNASAADRWQWINSSDAESVYLDTQTITYDYGYSTSKSTKPVGATAWVKFFEPNINKATLLQNYFSFINNTITGYSYAIYIDDKLEDSGTIPSYSRKEEPIIPGSFGEDVKRALMRRAGIY